MVKPTPLLIIASSAVSYVAPKKREKYSTPLRKFASAICHRSVLMAELLVLPLNPARACLYLLRELLRALVVGVPHNLLYQHCRCPRPLLKLREESLKFFIHISSKIQAFSISNTNPSQTVMIFGTCLKSRVYFSQSRLLLFIFRNYYL